MVVLVITAVVAGVFSLVGGFVLLLSPQLARSVSIALASFAAGTLLGTAFLHLMPEAFERGGGESVYVLTLGGFLAFFLLERVVRVVHHHRHWHHAGPGGSGGASATVPMIIIGDTLHNFIDGVVLGTTFLISVPLGLTTAIAITAHEIPQEIGDFSVLLHRGMSRARVLTVNLVTALATALGAVTAYALGRNAFELLPVVLPVAAGFFLYIAAADLIPEIQHQHGKERFPWMQPLLLFAGVGLVAAVSWLLE